MRITFLTFLLFKVTVFAAKTADLAGTLYCQNKQMKEISTFENAKSADRIVVQKKYQKLYLLNQGKIIRSYDVAMGPSANLGPKAFQGDKKTPEGLYDIEFKNPKSNYYLALKISYPNAKDIAYAKINKQSAGDLIMIHGFPVKPMDGLIPQIVKDVLHTRQPKINWTAGCIAVTDREIEEIYSLVAEGTQIEICPL